MAGPLDSLRAGLGDPEARERFREEQAIRAAEAQSAAAQEEARQTYLRERAAPTIQQVKDTLGNSVLGPLFTGEARPADVARAQLSSTNDAAIQALQQPEGPSGFDVAGTAAEVGGSYLADAKARAERLSGTHVVKKNNPMHGPVSKFVDTSRQAEGTERAGFEAEQTAKLAASKAYAEHFADEYGRVSGQADAADAAHAARMQRLSDQEHAVRSAQEAQQKAVEAFAKIPDEDPTGGWVDTPAWKKVLFSLSAAMMYIGGLDPFSHINAAIQRNIEAQRSNKASARDKVNARAGIVQQNQSVYDQILETVQDERAADIILENAHWKQAEAKMASMAAKLGVDLMQPQQQQLLAQMQKRQAANELELSRLAANNPKAFYSRQLDIQGPARDVEKMLLKHELDRAGKGEDASYDFAKEGLKEGGGPGGRELSEGEARKLQQDRQEREFQFRQRQEQSGGLAGQRLQSGRGLIHDWLDKFGTDVPAQSEGTIPNWIPFVGGKGAIDEADRPIARMFADPDLMKEDMDLRNLIAETLTTNITGAVASPLQVKRVTDLILDPNLSGNQVRIGMRSALRMLDLQQQAAERTLEDKPAADYRGVSEDQLPKMEPLRGGRSPSNLSPEEEARRLGGKLK